MTVPVLTQQQVEAAELAKRFVDHATDWAQINELISQLQEMGRNRLGPDYSNPSYDI